MKNSKSPFCSVIDFKYKPLPKSKIFFNGVKRCQMGIELSRAFGTPMIKISLSFYKQMCGKIHDLLFWIPH